MIGTNRDLAAMRNAIENELMAMKLLRRMQYGVAGTAAIDRKLASLMQKHAALCVAMASRRIEASQDVVVFSRWVSGNGALDWVVPGISGAYPQPDRAAQQHR